MSKNECKEEVQNEYKSLKLKEVQDYKNMLYENYKDQIKIVNAYIVALSSSAIMAFFILINRLQLSENILLLVKFTAGFFIASLLIIVIINIFYSIKSSEDEQKYADLYETLKCLHQKDEIQNELQSHYEDIVNNNFFTLLAYLRYFAYIFFIIAICIISYAILTF